MTYNRSAVAGGFLVGIILLTIVLKVKFYFFPPADNQPSSVVIDTPVVSLPTATFTVVVPVVSVQPAVQFVQSTAGGAGLAPTVGTTVTASDHTHLYSAQTISATVVTLTVSDVSGQLLSQQELKNSGRVVSLIPDVSDTLVVVSQTTNQLLFTKVALLGVVHTQASVAWTEPINQVVRDHNLIYVVQARAIAVLSDNLATRYPDITLATDQSSPFVKVTDTGILVTYTKAVNAGNYQLYTDEYSNLATD